MAGVHRFYREMLRGIKKPNLRPPAYCPKHLNPWVLHIPGRLLRISDGLKKSFSVWILFLKKTSSFPMAALKCVLTYLEWDFILRGRLGVSVTQARGPCAFSTGFLLDAAGNTMALKPIAKKWDLRRGSAASRSVAKIQDKTQDPRVSLWGSGAAVLGSAVQISVRSLKSKHTCPPDRKMLNKGPPPCWLALWFLFSP